MGFGLDAGDATGQAKGVGVEPHSLRDYTEGEHVRNIHWKTSARLGRPVVLEYVVEETRQIRLVLDDQLGMDPQAPARFEKAIVLASSLGAALLGQGFEVGLKAGGDSVPPGHGASHLDSILRMLAALEPATERSGDSDTFSRNSEGDGERMLSVHISHSDGTGSGGGMGDGVQPTVVIPVDQWDLIRGEWRPSGGLLAGSVTRPGARTFGQAAA